MFMSPNKTDSQPLNSGRMHYKRACSVWVTYMIQCTTQIKVDPIKVNHQVLEHCPFRLTQR
jgi:hypothetical protein